MCVQVLCVRTYLYMQALIHMYASHVHVCARLYMYVQAHICMIPLCVYVYACADLCAHMYAAPYPAEISSGPLHCNHSYND